MHHDDAEEDMTTTFESLGVAEDICDALRDRGITSAFPIQEMTIPDILAGRDVCGKAKTGSGKTLAFGLPLLQILPVGPARTTRPALALVPTRELATQVRDELTPGRPRPRRPHRRHLRRRSHREADPSPQVGRRPGRVHPRAEPST